MPQEVVEPPKYDEKQHFSTAIIFSFFSEVNILIRNRVDTTQIPARHPEAYQTYRVHILWIGMLSGDISIDLLIT